MALAVGASQKEGGRTPAVLTAFPRLVTSGSTLSLGQEAARVWGAETAEVRSADTVQACRDLMDGAAEILIIGEPAAEIWDEKEAREASWEMSPFALDSLAFLAEADNPVENLTLEELRAIYAGDVGNWSQVGGPDRGISPGAEGEESRTALRNLVADPSPEGGEGRENGTETLICVPWHQVRNGAEGWKVLTIDDRKLLWMGYYIITASGLEAEDPASVLREWLLGPEGQRLAAQQGLTVEWGKRS